MIKKETSFVKMQKLLPKKMFSCPWTCLENSKVKRWFKERFSKALLALVAVGLVSCSSEPLPELYINEVSIYTEPDANQNSAIAVDLVLIYDFELVKILGQMSATTYFSSSRQLLLDNPTLLDIWHWELVPGQIVQKFEPPQERGDAFAAYVFANYLTPGDHRVRVAPNGNVKILLLRDDLKNLATYNTPDVRMGTTMTNIPREDEEDNIENDVNVGSVRLGPVKTMSSPCSKNFTRSTQMCGVNMNQSLNLCPPRKPVSITTRPLSPPPPCGRPSTLNKVKVWRN